MKEFFCVHVEFYDYGKTLACITTSPRRGKSHYRRVYGLTAFKMWWSSESYAKQLLKEIENGSIDQDDILSIWSDFQDWENDAFFKGRAA